MPNHFIEKLTERGGPPPLQVLAQIMDLADSSPSREAWFGTHKPGKAWDGSGICILLAAPMLDAIIAEVIDRSDEAPDDPATMDLYGKRAGFVTWWHIRNPIRIRFESLEAVPGRGKASKQSAAHVFKGQASFAYWDFEHASFDRLATELSQGDLKRTDPPAVSLPTPHARSTTVSEQRLWPRPEVPVCGVDFSGGEEDQRYGNRKIWIAEWLPGKGVALRCGRSGDTANKICRSDLASLIKLGGWWSLDFPFGIAKETARALGVHSWPEWLKWCAGRGDATMLRDDAREATERAGVKWGLRRRVDESHGTTWFPLFEQLYRQTIYGAREVLLPLYDAGVCVLPWGCAAMTNSAVVVEGFPGAAVRDHLLKRRVSYKGSTPAHELARHAIVRALKSAPFAIPVPDDVAIRAVEDCNGDALDALSLLVASWTSLRLQPYDWKQQLSLLDVSGAAVEGWFPN